MTKVHIGDPARRAAAPDATDSRSVGRLPERSTRGPVPQEIGPEAKRFARLSRDSRARVASRVNARLPGRLGGSIASATPSMLKGMENRERHYFGSLPPEHNDAWLDRQSDWHVVRRSQQRFAAGRKVSRGDGLIAETGSDWGPEAKRALVSALFSDIDRLVGHNPTKAGLLRRQVERFIDLVDQAKVAGDLSSSLDFPSIARLMQENVIAVAYQDHVAAENVLGEHGVRHLMFDIRVAEEVLDQLESHGQPVSALDRLLVHQAIVLHDIGYASVPMREGINAGNSDSGAGHNVIAAKALRQRAEKGDPVDPLLRVFNAEHIERMHEIVLTHDFSEIAFVLDGSEAASRQNTLAAVRLADNAHAFEDKLPELLYEFPETLKVMRLIRSAAELGRDEVVKELKGELAREISSLSHLPDDDRGALTRAVQLIDGTSYRRTVDRLAGRDPQIRIASDGHVTVEVRESRIANDIQRLFGLSDVRRMKRFSEDLTGVPMEDAKKALRNSGRVDGERIRVVWKNDADAAKAFTDTERRVLHELSEPRFQEYAERDSGLARSAKRLTEAIELEKPKKLAKVLEQAGFDPPKRAKRSDKEYFMALCGVAEAAQASIDRERSALFDRYRAGEVGRPH